MNTNNSGSSNNEAERNLRSWERFVRAYCAANGMSSDAVMRDHVLVEVLNIQWLRRRATDGERSQSESE